MREIKISLPETIKDCNPFQLSKWLLLTLDADLTTLSNKLDFQLSVVSAFSGISQVVLGHLTTTQLRTEFVKCMEMLTAYKEAEPKGEVTINGKKYIFNKDFKSYTAGQIADIKSVEDINREPWEVLSKIYIEEGLKYNHLDENNNPINPSKERAKIFKFNFDGEEFLNVFAFFLNYYQDMKLSMYAMNIATMKSNMKEIELTIG